MKILLVQIIKFGLAGIISTIVNFVIFSCLVEKDINYLITNVIAYIISMVVNYWLSMNFVFARKEQWSKVKEFIVFVVLSLGGLAIEEAALWLIYNCVLVKVSLPILSGGSAMGKKISKICATAVLWVYNFVSRKIFLEKKSGGDKI